jgi:small multidrug resistance pump
MAYIYLVVAIIAEVIATSTLKASEEFTKLIPSLIVIVGYGVAFYFLTLVLRTIPVGITYALWSGLGIVLVTIVALFLYKQTPDAPAIIGMTLIIAGVVIINIFSKTIKH